MTQDHDGFVGSILPGKRYDATLKDGQVWMVEVCPDPSVTERVARALARLELQMGDPEPVWKQRVDEQWHLYADLARAAISSMPSLEENDLDGAIERMREVPRVERTIRMGWLDEDDLEALALAALKEGATREGLTGGEEG